MSDLDHRWQRLVAASRRSPAPDAPPSSTAFLERAARRGLAARSTPSTQARARGAEPLAWASLVSMAAVAVITLHLTRNSVAPELDALGQELSGLLRHVPPAPELPVVFTLPPPDEALARIPDGPALRSALGLPTHPEDTP